MVEPCGSTYFRSRKHMITFNYKVGSFSTTRSCLASHNTSFRRSMFGVIVVRLSLTQCHFPGKLPSIISDSFSRPYFFLSTLDTAMDSPDHQSQAGDAETPGQKQARLRRERREAKIKAGGSSRLEKITNVSGRQNLPGMLPKGSI